MEELVKKVLDEYFADYKNYHLWILIGFTLLIGATQILQTLWISKRLERFKNQLKKSEIKFSRYSELQINALRSIYHLLCEFHRANIRLFDSTPENIGHNDYKYLLKNWIEKYYAAADELAKERILLTPEITATVSDSIKAFDSVKNIVQAEHKHLSEFEADNFGSHELMYEFEENEIETISKAIEKLKKEDVIKNSNKTIKKLRDKIEEHFININE